MQRAAYLVALFLASAALVPIWTLDRFPSQDAPNHLYAAHVLGKLEAPPFKERFRRHEGATTNRIFHEVVPRLATVVGLDAAHRLWLSLYALLFVFGALYLAGSVDRERTPLGLLVVPFVFNWLLTTGFYNFVITVPVWAFAVGLLLRHPAPRLTHRALLALLGLVAALGHPLTLFVLGASAAVVTRSWRERWLAGAALAPALALVVYGVVRSASGEVGLDWPGGFPGPLYNLATAFYRFALPYGVGELWSALPAFLVITGAAVVTLARARRVPLAFPARLTLLLGALFLVLPERSFDFDHVCTRFVVFIVLSLPLWIDARPLLARPRAFFALAAALSLGQLALFTRGALEIDRDLAEARASAPHLPRGKNLLPLTFDGRGGPRVIWPLLHAWAYTAIERDAFAPFVLYAHATRPASLLAHRADAPPLPVPEEALPERLASGALCASFRAGAGRSADCAPAVEAAWGRLVDAACAYDAVYTFAAPPETPTRLARCMRPVFQRGRTALYLRTPR